MFPLGSSPERSGRRQHDALPATTSNDTLGSVLNYGEYITAPCLIKTNGRVVGEVRSDGVFQKHIRFSCHLYRKYTAICLGVDTLEQAELAGAVWAEVHDDDSGRIYHAPLAAIRAHGIPIHHGDRQIALPLKQWQLGPVAAPAPSQLGLWQVAP